VSSRRGPGTGVRAAIIHWKASIADITAQRGPTAR
jgi:hypothetical protein